MRYIKRTGYSNLFFHEEQKETALQVLSSSFQVKVTPALRAIAPNRQLQADEWIDFPISHLSQLDAENHHSEVVQPFVFTPFLKKRPFRELMRYVLVGFFILIVLLVIIWKYTSSFSGQSVLKNNPSVDSVRASETLLSDFECQ